MLAFTLEENQCDNITAPDGQWSFNPGKANTEQRKNLMGLP